MSDLCPIVVKPVKVVEGPGITIMEYFGHVASKDGTASFAIATVKGADEAGFQTPQFSEYVICNEGAIDFVQDNLTRTRIEAGQGAFLPKGLRVKWTWPEATTYTVVCMPAFSPELSCTEVNDPSCTVVDQESRRKLARLHGVDGPVEQGMVSSLESANRPSIQVVKPVDVVEAPGITISEHFGNIASHDATASLAVAVVKAASEEAFQVPQFDEYVICVEGAIEFAYGDGNRVKIGASEGVFLPKNLRVKWIWPQPTKYFVLCLPAFSPVLSGREAEEGTTVAKDSKSMQKLEALHEAVRSESDTAVGA